jgi:hypothetical protein
LSQASPAPGRGGLQMEKAPSPLRVRNSTSQAPDMAFKIPVGIGRTRSCCASEVDGAWREWNEWIYHPTDADSNGLSRRLSGNNTYEAARYYLHRRVNAQLRGTINAAVLPYLQGAIRFFPDSLVTAAYLRFAQDLAGRLGAQRECEYCRLPFQPTRRDRRFCRKNCQEAFAYHRRVAGTAVGGPGGMNRG